MSWDSSLKRYFTRITLTGLYLKTPLCYQLWSLHERTVLKKWTVLVWTLLSCLRYTKPYQYLLLTAERKIHNFTVFEIGLEAVQMQRRANWKLTFRSEDLLLLSCGNIMKRRWGKNNGTVMSTVWRSWCHPCVAYSSPSSDIRTVIMTHCLCFLGNLKSQAEKK